MSFLSSLRENMAVARLQKRMARSFPSFREQKEWLSRLHRIDRNVELAHNPSHLMEFLVAIFELDPSVPGCIVEAGAYKGGGTAKISLAAAAKNRDVFVFDSFEGLPANEEAHEKSVTGYSIRGWFEKGKFCGSLDEVKNNVRTFGDIDRCHFIPGWFDDTMPGFHEPVALAYLDVDLAASTRTCLKYLFPLLSRGGAIYSQDGDFPLVIDVFRDEKFWIEEVGCERVPEIRGLGKKITVILK